LPVRTAKRRGSPAAFVAINASVPSSLREATVSRSASPLPDQTRTLPAAASPAKSIQPSRLPSPP
jgi:hypothetical protein